MDNKTGTPIAPEEVTASISKFFASQSSVVMAVGGTTVAGGIIMTVGDHVQSLLLPQLTLAQVLAMMCVLLTSLAWEKLGSNVRQRLAGLILISGSLFSNVVGTNTISTQVIVPAIAAERNVVEERIAQTRPIWPKPDPNAPPTPTEDEESSLSFKS